ncbi:MAG TPA: hypothetical protein GXZ48_07955 [Acholeplasmataceae bacterium]|nr:hypothetical protein [Acholeplasmataceae bacterium]
MNSKTLKIWYSISGVFAGLAILYYVVRLFDRIFNAKDIEGTLLDKLNIVAIIFLAIALIMLLLAIPLSKMIENKSQKVDEHKISNAALLEKYKSKKTRRN